MIVYLCTYNSIYNIAETSYIKSIYNINYYKDNFLILLKYPFYTFQKKVSTSPLPFIKTLTLNWFNKAQA